MQTGSNNLDVGATIDTFDCQFIDGQSFLVTFHTFLKTLQVRLGFLYFIRMERHGAVNLRQLPRCCITLTEEVLALGFQGGYLLDRKSTRLNSSHANISYAAFC